MKDKKLIPLSDFVLEENKKQGQSMKLSDFHSNLAESYDLIVSYTNFLKQPLTLGMFVPVDKHGNVLKYKGFKASYKKSQKYYKADEKVLFEGFQLTYNGFSIDAIDKQKDADYRLSFNKDGQCRQYYNIEELINSDYPPLTLTRSALKAIGINEN
ncbi:hypothetical protein [Chryseobacterium sp. EO14]|uniref:hypothetical protein n=1 Tax=Chryseobacterium sp. EO14 TaxID=2950551 RepID=UPI00210E11F1|nr:hypothetical protein [Chryseobacterium sp. EO14]MCQ4139211.1 hypothetical protein [Chryseobacterium sp. EO14]